MTAPTPKTSAAELAEQLGVTPKEFRVYLRANAVPKDDETGRYAFNKLQVKKHLKDYPAWSAHRVEARAAAKAAKEAVATPAQVDPIDAAREALLETHDEADITDEMLEEMMRVQQGE